MSFQTLTVKIATRVFILLENAHFILINQHDGLFCVLRKAPHYLWPVVVISLSQMVFIDDWLHICSTLLVRGHWGRRRHGRQTLSCLLIWYALCHPGRIYCSIGIRLSLLTLSNRIWWIVAIWILFVELTQHLPHVLVIRIAFHFICLFCRCIAIVWTAHSVYCQLESIIQHSRKKHFEEVRALLEARVRIRLNQPGVEFPVNNIVIPKYFEALTSPVRV